MAADSFVHVAVGVVSDSDGNILISRRAAHQHQGNRWEFPGGKVESSETVQQALARELAEELNLEVLDSAPLTVVEHNYPEKRVRLDVWLVTSFAGQVQGREGQAWRWVPKHQLQAYEFPDANQAILDAILIENS